jgi:hypothetical protein
MHRSKYQAGPVVSFAYLCVECPYKFYGIMKPYP